VLIAGRPGGRHAIDIHALPELWFAVGAPLDTTLLIARIALAAVLIAAGLAKLVDPSRTRESLAGFGVAPSLRAPVAIALPLAELLLAGLLVPRTTATGAAIAVAVLLLAFSGAIARAIALGERPDCNCFGALRSRPVGFPALVRNALLTAGAVLIAAAGPGQSVGRALAGVSTLAAVAVAGLVLALVAQAWFSYELFRQNGRLLERVRALEESDREPGRPAQPAGLPEGSIAPSFELADVFDGELRSLEDLLAAGRPLALAFVDPDCGACGPLLPRLAAIAADPDVELELAIITRGTREEARSALDGHAVGPTLLQRDREVAEAYGVHGVPSAVLISPDGRIASEAAIGDRSVERLLRTRGRVDVDLHVQKVLA
jgi:uncharacterized membrane protein YphA (DoxX/SURF4 family)